jgi:hypothetical protein
MKGKPNMSNTTTTGTRRARGAPSSLILPVADLAAARPFLIAPFAAETIGFLPRRPSPNASWANVFAFVSLWDEEARLDLTVGPENWKLGEPTVLDANHVWRNLTVFGVTQTDVGQGRDRVNQSTNAAKRCALHFGIGRYLKHVRPVRLELGDGQDKLPVTRKGSPYIPEHMLPGLRAAYEREVHRLSPVFGPMLVHPTRAWAPPTAAPAAAATPAASATPAPPATPNTNGARSTPTAAANPHGERVRNAAASRGLNVAQLANMILAAADRPAQPPQQAAALLERLLARIPQDIAERVLATLGLAPSAAAGPTADRRPIAPAAAGSEQPPRAPDRSHSPSGTVSVDFARLGPDPDSLAA